MTRHSENQNQTLAQEFEVPSPTVESANKKRIKEQQAIALQQASHQHVQAVIDKRNQTHLTKAREDYELALLAYEYEEEAQDRISQMHDEFPPLFAMTEEQRSNLEESLRELEFLIDNYDDYTVFGIDADTSPEEANEKIAKFIDNLTELEATYKDIAPPEAKDRIRQVVVQMKERGAHLLVSRETLRLEKTATKIFHTYQRDEQLRIAQDWTSVHDWDKGQHQAAKLGAPHNQPRPMALFFDAFKKELHAAVTKNVSYQKGEELVLLLSPNQINLVVNHLEGIKVEDFDFGIIRRLMQSPSPSGRRSKRDDDQDQDRDSDDEESRSSFRFGG